MIEKDETTFKQLVWEFYKRQGRHDLPWRLPDLHGRFDPYRIVVSELMLQQTQVSRVVPKFQTFLGQFPQFSALAQAPLADVLRAWSGLGYNRRAKFLWETARAVTHDFGGELPRTTIELIGLPGIGPNTTGAIQAYAFNMPSVFIETNIRSVFIHHFFANRTDKVTDRELRELVEATIDKNNPREWYWALMDYGSYLKQTIGTGLERVHGYRPQSRFEGSRRQIRGQVLKLLGEGPIAEQELISHISDERLGEVLSTLVSEHLIEKIDSAYRLQGHVVQFGHE